MSDMDEIAQIDGPPLSVAGMRWPADYPALGRADKPAVIFEGRITSYAELDRQSSGFVALLEQRGIGPGDRIAYLGRNSDVYLPVVFGSLRHGAVLVPLNWRCTAAELRFIVADAAARLVICDAEFHEVALAAAGGSAMILGAAGPDGVAGLLARQAPGGWSARDPDATALLMYTSGTTGKPKGVRVSQRMVALARHAEMISTHYADWAPDDVLLSPMPSFHMGGLSFMLAGFCRGLTCVLTADTTPQGLLRLCQEYGVARTFIVPTVVRAMLERMRAAGTVLPLLKEIQYGASPMDVALLEACIERIGCRFMHHYGMTENAGSATRLGGRDHDVARPHLLRSVGTPQAGLSIQIRGADGAVLRRGEAGEIWIRSATLMAGYWHREAASREVLVDGWYRTGDGGYLDAQGFLFLTDRIKDMVVSGGENVYPAEVEEALRAHPGVAECAVFGLPDARWGEMVTAAVEARPGCEMAAAELVAHLRVLIAGYKIPKRFIFGVALPRTATGKIQRGEARMRALDRI